jgi:hypothetical protein
VTASCLVACLPLSLVFLVLGLFGPLVWVYLSVATAVAAMPLGVAVAFIAARRNQYGGDLVFRPPPGWPVPPQEWVPFVGWRPDPEWPAAPGDWTWWA